MRWVGPLILDTIGRILMSGLDEMVESGQIRV